MSLYTGFAVSLNHKLHGNMFCMQYKTSWYRASQPVTSHSCSPARCMISGFKAMPRSNDCSSALPPPHQQEVQHTGLSNHSDSMNTRPSPTQTSPAGSFKKGSPTLIRPRQNCPIKINRNRSSNSIENFHKINRNDHSKSIEMSS